MQGGSERGPAFHKEFTAGRQGSLVIGDEHASGQHALFQLAHGFWFVQDLDSTNGTWLNNRRVYQAQRLKKGDKMKIGRTSSSPSSPPDQLGDLSAANAQRSRVDQAAGLPSRRGPLPCGPRGRGRGTGRHFKPRTLIQIIPNDFLGPNPEEVQLWLRFPAARPGDVSKP